MSCRRSTGLTAQLFTRIHHFGPRASLESHRKYCQGTKSFRSQTNIIVARRLAECLKRLDSGGDWESAIKAILFRSTTRSLERSDELSRSPLGRTPGKASGPRCARRNALVVARAIRNRYANRATWAATEVKVSSKYDLRYMSEGVFRACERLGDLRTWVGLISPRFGGQRDYAAKAATRVRNSYSIGLR
jgi:hypothetical protein